MITCPELGSNKDVNTVAELVYSSPLKTKMKMKEKEPRRTSNLPNCVVNIVSSVSISIVSNVSMRSVL